MDLRKLASEVDIKNAVEAFEILRQDTDLFYSWNRLEVQKLCENMKVLSFMKNVTIIQRNENVEYFGIILSGRVLIKQGDNMIGRLGPGDVIGYMSYFDFAGTKISPFEITSEGEGYLATFRYDEFKQLSKKDPQLAYKITEMLARKVYNTISLQYVGEDLYKPAKLKCTGGATNTKKVKDAVETCPELAEFFDRMEVRDKKNLTKTLEFVDFEREQKIVHEGLAADFLIILIRGELISFREGKPSVFYKPGTIIGAKEFLYGLSWSENILGKAKGILLKLTRTNFEEMKHSSGPSACGFVKNLMWHQCKEIKNRYQDRSPLLDKTRQNVLNPLNEFVEYEITKHIEFLNSQHVNLGVNKPDIKEFMNKKQVLPLYMHKVHQNILAAKKHPGEASKSGKPEPTIGGCAFLREKMERQLEEARLNKIKNKGKLQVKKEAVMTSKVEDKGQTDEDYEDVKNSFILMENENKELRELLNKAMEENKALNKHLKEHRELLLTSNTRINKVTLHKELMSKDFINNDPAIFLTKNYNAQFASFGDVLEDQHFVSSKARRVAKFAYKWLAVTKQRRRILGV